MKNPFKSIWNWFFGPFGTHRVNGKLVSFSLPPATSFPPMPKTLPPKNQKPTRRQFIETYAYSLAEKDGFRKEPLDYWLAAEKYAEHSLFSDDPEVIKWEKECEERDKKRNR